MGLFACLGTVVGACEIACGYVRFEYATKLPVYLEYAAD